MAAWVKATTDSEDTIWANMDHAVTMLLRKYGEPPDLQDAAVQNVLQQAEALSVDWAA
jgi:type I restriction enzyme R subunit